MEYRITSQVHGGAVAAVGEAVLAMVDYRGGGGRVPVAAELRQRIEKLEAEG